jgi:hypothetical protein
MKRVIGIGLDGSNVSTTLGKVEVPLISASYGDKLEPGTLSAMGGQQIDEITPGNYATDDAQLKLSSVVFRTIIMPAMPATGGGNVRMPIVVSRSHPDLGDDSDLLEGCRIINWAAAVENSNKAEEVTLNVTVRQIRWTYARKTINQLRGPDGSIALPAGTSGF